MTHVFSGVGMSRWVADRIGDIPDACGFVMPTYGWRVPRIVRRKILESAAPGRDTFVWAVFTCGDDAGYIDRDLEGLLGRPLDAAYTVVMPDTYLGLPGFKLDSQEEKEAKLDAAGKRCDEIRERLAAHERARDMKRGPFARIKTSVIGRIFDRLLVTDRFFRLSPGKCVSCGECAKSCPAHAITAGEDGRPRWKKDGSCTGCFRCYHRCPGDAIEFGPFTRGKGRLRTAP